MNSPIAHPAATSRKARILLVICWPVGGIRTFVRYVYNRFDPSRYCITILAPDQPELHVLLEDLRGLDAALIPVRHGARHPRFILRTWRTILSNRFDIVHSQGFMAGVYSAIPARLRRIPHIVTSHDVLLPQQFAGFKGSLRKAFFRLLLPRIDVIHSVSHDASTNLTDTIPRLAHSHGKCITIPNGIDVGQFQSIAARNLREELKLPEQVFLIGFLGRFMSQKGFRYLVDALEILLNRGGLSRDPIVVATGSGGFVREDTEYLRQKGLEAHVRFLPFSRDIGPILKALDVVAMPSLWEACPLLPMEAMVVGVPVIGTDCIGLREVLRGTPSRVVPFGSSMALAGAIEAEIRSPSRRAALAFVDEARRRFDVTRQARQMESLIESLLPPATP